MEFARSPENATLHKMCCAPAQGEQFAPAANAPGGQVVLEVTLGAATHTARRVVCVRCEARAARGAGAGGGGAGCAANLADCDKQR
jgi:hypothetical protein